MEINRFIRVLQSIAEEYKGEDLFVKVNTSDGGVEDPEVVEFQFYNDSSDRFILIYGN